MRRAALDIGTNSVLLLVAERSAVGRWHPIEERCEITRLGEGVDATSALGATAVRRTLDAVSTFVDRARALGAAGLKVAGTSALRDANNGSFFLDEVRRIAGVSVEVISGEREAALVLAGVQTSFGELPSGSVVFDVGGGSTELIRVGAGGGVAILQSLDIGSVRLKERFVRADPPTTAELEATRESIRAALAGLRPDLLEGLGKRAYPRLVGASGTITTLYAIEAKLRHYDPSRVDGQRLSTEQVSGLCERLAALSLTERRRLPGLEPRRADVIVSGALIVAEVMNLAGAHTLEVADRGVRWGLLTSA